MLLEREGTCKRDVFTSVLKRKRLRSNRDTVAWASGGAKGLQSFRHWFLSTRSNLMQACDALLPLPFHRRVVFVDLSLKDSGAWNRYRPLTLFDSRVALRPPTFWTSYRSKLARIPMESL